MKTQFLPGAIALLLLTGCGQSAKDLATKHLSFIQKGDVVNAKAQYCSLQAPLKLYKLDSFEVVSDTPKKLDKFSYQEVTANIETSQKLVDKDTYEQKPIKQVQLQVWKSEEFYNQAVAFAVKLNAITGTSKVDNPKREDYNQSGYCVNFAPD